MLRKPETECLNAKPGPRAIAWGRFLGTDCSRTVDIHLTAKGEHTLLGSSPVSALEQLASKKEEESRARHLREDQPNRGWSTWRRGARGRSTSTRSDSFGGHTHATGVQKG